MPPPTLRTTTHGLAEPETRSGEFRQAVFSARQELAEANRRIVELEAEAAQSAARKRDAEEDILRGLEAHVEKLVTTKVAEAMSRQSQPSFVLRVETPAPFQPMALPQMQPAPPPPQAVALAPPMALPPMRAPAPSSVTDQDVADAAAARKAEMRLKWGGILIVPLIGLTTAVVAMVSSHYSNATPQYVPPVYIAPAAPPGTPQTLPVMRAAPVPH